MSRDGGEMSELLPVATGGEGVSFSSVESESRACSGPCTLHAQLLSLDVESGVAAQLVAAWPLPRRLVCVARRLPDLSPSPHRRRLAGGAMLSCMARRSPLQDERMPPPELSAHLQAFCEQHAAREAPRARRVDVEIARDRDRPRLGAAARARVARAGLRPGHLPGQAAPCDDALCPHLALACRGRGGGRGRDGGGWRAGGDQRGRTGFWRERGGRQRGGGVRAVCPSVSAAEVRPGCAARRRQGCVQLHERRERHQTKSGDKPLAWRECRGERLREFAGMARVTVCQSFCDSRGEHSSTQHTAVTRTNRPSTRHPSLGSTGPCYARRTIHACANGGHLNLP